MGLDWNPAPKARPGRGAEFTHLRRQLEQRANWLPWRRAVADFLANRFSLGSTDRHLQESFEAAAVLPYETLAAPRVGIDSAATAWACERYESLSNKRGSLDQFLESLRGYWVLDLVPKCDGLPAYTNDRAYDGIDLYSFRGQFLADCEEGLGRALLDEAWQIHNPAQLRDYAARLAQAATSFADRTKTKEWLDRRDPPDEFEGPAAQTHIMTSAAKWCRFWSEHGHGLEPYY